MRKLLASLPRTVAGALVGGLVGFCATIGFVFTCAVTSNSGLDDILPALLAAVVSIAAGAAVGGIWAFRRGRGGPKPPAPKP